MAKMKGGVENGVAEERRMGNEVAESEENVVFITQYTNYFAQIFDSILYVREHTYACACVYVCVTHTKIFLHLFSTANKIEIRNCSFVSIILFHFSIMFCWQNEKNLLKKFLMRKRRFIVCCR